MIKKLDISSIKEDENMLKNVEYLMENDDKFKPSSNTKKEDLLEIPMHGKYKYIYFLVKDEDKKGSVMICRCKK